MPTSYDEEERIYHKGFRDGWRAALSEYMAEGTFSSTKAPTPTKKARKPRKKDPKMARALEEANRKGRTSKGNFRKGWDQARIMRTAHKIKKGL